MCDFRTHLNHSDADIRGPSYLELDPVIQREKLLRMMHFYVSTKQQQGPDHSLVSSLAGTLEINAPSRGRQESRLPPRIYSQRLGGQQQVPGESGPCIPDKYITKYK